MPTAISLIPVFILIATALMLLLIVIEVRRKEFKWYDAVFALVVVTLVTAILWPVYLFEVKREAGKKWRQEHPNSHRRLG